MLDRLMSITFILLGFFMLHLADGFASVLAFVHFWSHLININNSHLDLRRRLLFCEVDLLSLQLRELMHALA